MSTYNLSFANVELNETAEQTVTVEISGSAFPQPNNNQLSLTDGGTLTGSFAADEGAPTVDAFTFVLPGEHSLSDISELQFEGYPAGYSGVPLTATFSFNSHEFDLVELSATKKGGIKHLSSQVRKTVTAIAKKGETEEAYSITSFDLVPGSNGEENVGEMLLAESATPHLSATLNGGVDFNALTTPFLIEYKLDSDPGTSYNLCSMTLKDN